MQKNKGEKGQEGDRMNNKLKKTAIVTGATSGIGLGFCKSLAKRGYHLVMVSSRKKELERICHFFEKAYPKQHFAVICQDLSCKGAAAKVYHAIKKSGYEIDILVNNAGFGVVGAAEEIAMEREEEMCYVNMITPMQLCKFFLKDMKARRSGKIVNVASTGAFQPGPYTASYFASKAYISSYSRAISHEASKSSVDVVTLYPGTTRTKFFAKTGKKTPVWAMSPDKVAEIACNAMEKGKKVIVTGRLNQLLRIVPSEIKMKAIAIMKK